MKRLDIFLLWSNYRLIPINFEGRKEISFGLLHHSTLIFFQSSEKYKTHCRPTQNLSFLFAYKYSHLESEFNFLDPKKLSINLSVS